MKTVERIIGHKRGTGGSSGVGFLRRALEQTFFPELIDVRTVIGARERHASMRIDATSSRRSRRPSPLGAGR